MNIYSFIDLKDMGVTNPGADTNDTNDVGDDSGKSSTIQNHDDEDTSGCFSRGPLSPDSEYDETLEFPDSVTILSMGGDKPILIERKEVDDIDSIPPETEIPFSAVYRPPVKFKSIQRKVFIPGVEIHVQIIENERSVTTHLLNPNL